MPRRKHYPDEIDLKVEKRVDRTGSNSFSTQDRLEAAEFIEAHWPIQFQQLEQLSEREGLNDGEGFSRSHFQNVYNEYFGPEGTDLTFDEIDDKHGSLEAFMNRQEQPRDATKDRSEMTDHELEIYERGVRFGYELATKEHKSDRTSPTPE